ncbi:low temperature requirement protein A [Streptomyces hawaiiensis]|uniref:low temperature requirement protein A n=1 Tax=Streptomyces hawaiiensis TaxID=67305 RepID=UPI003651FE6E
MTPSPPPPPVPSDAPGGGRGPLRRLRARGRDEAHRTASPLELFFDLCFVVAVAQAGIQLVHSVAEGHAGRRVWSARCRWWPERPWPRAWPRGRAARRR